MLFPLLNARVKLFDGARLIALRLEFRNNPELSWLSVPYHSLKIAVMYPRQSRRLEFVNRSKRSGQLRWHFLSRTSSIDRAVYLVSLALRCICGSVPRLDLPSIHNNPSPKNSAPQSSSLDP